MIAYENGVTTGSRCRAVLVTVLEENASDSESLLWESHFLIISPVVALNTPPTSIDRSKGEIVERLIGLQDITASFFQEWAEEYASAHEISPAGPVKRTVTKEPFAGLAIAGFARGEMESLSVKTHSAELRKILEAALALPQV